MKVITALLILAFLVSACAPAPSSNGLFPIIGSDPDRLVETMDWAESETSPIAPDSFEEPLLLDTSTPSLVQVALKGGGCPPTAQVAVSGSPEDVTVTMNLGGAIQPAGVDCPEVLTTHILAIEFREPILLEGLTVTVVRATDPISEG